MYLAWFDADRKKPVAMKIAEAHERYVAKFGRQPLVCLVNPEDAIPDAAIALRPLSTIGRNCFWIGSDEDIEEEIQITPEPEAKPKRRARKQATAPLPAPAKPETPAPLESLSNATVSDDAKPTRARKSRPVAKVEQPILAPAPPAPVPTKRRPRRERPAA
jgi:hypothetical protein